MSAKAQSLSRGQRLCTAVAVCFFLAMNSCSPDSASSTVANQEPAPSEERVNQAAEPVKGTDEQRAPESLEKHGDELQETEGDLSSGEPPEGAKAKGRSMNTGSKSEKTTKSEATMASRYFPLPKGASWQYGLKVFDGDGKVVTEATVEKRVEGVKTIDGKDYQRLTTKTLSGRNLRPPDQHYRLTDEGVCAAVDGVAGKELLVFPSNPDSKRRWTAGAPPIIKRVDGEAIVGEELTCGSEVYKGCVRVDLNMVMRGGGFFGPSEVSVRIERWFAPGVGMVRERRTADGQTIDAVLRKHAL